MSCLRDVWSEIRSSTAKFVEQLTQGSNPIVWESLLSNCLSVCSTKDIDWQSLEGCLAATCGLIENLNKFDSTPSNRVSFLFDKTLSKNSHLFITATEISYGEKNTCNNLASYYSPSS